MVKVKGTIRPMEIREIQAEGEDYAAAREALEAQVTEGWQLLSVLTDR
ncbi:hypothetical protein D477_006663 [Arthrobacter crystallopoietes BAB-32]|uniref:Uncharacterized protein n=1 Tax=Arthrobacter crystallopoietes BAB-32 TaxID=1246476 RepID=N1V0Y6_9MICC|nr:hypothetical protein D477_006663 [Arthrobacter crystallopoietes BAB-32]